MGASVLYTDNRNRIEGAATEISVSVRADTCTCEEAALPTGRIAVELVGRTHVAVNFGASMNQLILSILPFSSAITSI